MRRIHLCSILTSAVVLCGSPAQSATQSDPNARGEAQVTPCTGESWLRHLHRSFDNTSMGKTGHLGPGAQEFESSSPKDKTAFDSAPTRRVVRGSDLYRLNCEGCHGESGEGTPPEINSVINPVRATSVPLVMARMKSTGMDMSQADVANMVKQSKNALLQRLHSGGESMPSFSQLSAAEDNAILVYLNRLANVPGSPEDRAVVTESPERVGELIVKSTCHICHSAVGTNPAPQELLDGAIPPLNTLTARRSRDEFIRKVTYGYPVLMGTPPMLYRGRMPVFFYLSPEEAADVYLYLTLYPPSNDAANPPVALASLGGGMQSGSGGGSPARRASTKDEAGSPGMPGSEALLVAAVGAIVGLALAAGLYFTFREFKRLSGDGVSREAAPASLGVEPPTSAPPNVLEPAATPLQFSSVKQDKGYGS